MDISNYLNMMSAYLSGGERAADFLIGLVDGFMKEPDAWEDEDGEYNPLVNCTNDTCKRYMSGAVPFPKERAKAILNRMDIEHFATYLEESCSKDAQKAIGKRLEDIGYPVAQDGVAKACGTVFHDLLYHIIIQDGADITYEGTNQVQVMDPRVAYRATNLADLPVPEAVQPEELGCAQALLAMYGQDRGNPHYTMATLQEDEDWLTHFEKQRVYFYSAATLDQGVRDAYAPSEISPFEELMEECYEGVEVTWKKHHKSGKDRLEAVLEKVTSIDLGACRLADETRWINNRRRKGVCHFIAGGWKDHFDLKGWVRDDDGKKE